MGGYGPRAHSSRHLSHSRPDSRAIAMRLCRRLRRGRPRPGRQTRSLSLSPFTTFCYADSWPMWKVITATPEGRKEERKDGRKEGRREIVHNEGDAMPHCTVASSSPHSFLPSFLPSVFTCQPTEGWRVFAISALAHPLAGWLSLN